MNNQNISVNPEELKNSANTIRKCLQDLKDAKKLADNAWEDCMSSMSMGEQYINILNDNKMENDNTFTSAMDKLEIMSSYKQYSGLLELFTRQALGISDKGPIKKE